MPLISSILKISASDLPFFTLAKEFIIVYPPDFFFSGGISSSVKATSKHSHMNLCNFCSLLISSEVPFLFAKGFLSGHGSFLSSSFLLGLDAFALSLGLL